MSIRHAYACLVHERPDCVLDLVRNLRRLDPHSLVILYNGGRDRDCVPRREVEALGALVHPHPQPMVWGRLHGFALACLDFAQRAGKFELLTIVDSDQLLLRPGYVDFLEANVRLEGLGMLSTSPGRQERHSANNTVRSAWRDLRRWQPWLSRFGDGERRFAHYTFWPGSVFTWVGADRILERFRTDRLLQRTLQQTRMSVTEEILFPTLLTLLDMRVDANPCRQDWVRFRVPYTLADCDAALAEPAAFFMHPVQRSLDDPLRARIREYHGGYR